MTAIRDRLKTAREVSTLWLGLALAGASLPAAAQALGQDGDQPAIEPGSPQTVLEVADWVAASGDNRGLPFMVIDKTTAQVFVYGPEGQLRGETPALLGIAKGDHSAPGVGDRELADIPVADRTTPAGRFMAHYGPAIGTTEKVLWVDYETAISMHPVVTSNPKEHRLERLKSTTPDDNRITFGCINIAPAFYEDLVRPAFTGTGGVVYILPETMSLAEALPALQTQTATASAQSR